MDERIVSGRFLIRVGFDSIRNFHVHKAQGESHIHDKGTPHFELHREDHTTDLVKELDRCAKAFSKIPTDWWLEDEEIDALVDIGYALVRDSATYREFVGDGVLPANGKTVHDLCMAFTPKLEALEEERNRKAEEKTSQTSEPNDNPGN